LPAEPPKTKNVFLLGGDVDGDGHVLLRVGGEAAAVFVAILVLERLVHIPDAAVAVGDLGDEVVRALGRGGVGGEGGCEGGEAEGSGGEWGERERGIHGREQED